MGYFGKSITASDKYMDYESALLNFLGWVENDSKDYDPDDFKPHNERVGKEAFEGRVEEIVEWMKSHEMDIEHGIFLAYHLLIRGVDVSDKRLDRFIECCNEDSWSENDIERRIYMQLAAQAIENYKTDKTPIDIEFYYDFENYFIDNKLRELPPVEKVIEFFNLNAGINIINAYRSMFQLYFVISNEDFTRIKGQSIMGIKFITNLDRKSVV